jgi:hypothetical protein
LDRERRSRSPGRIGARDPPLIDCATVAGFGGSWIGWITYTCTDMIVVSFCVCETMMRPSLYIGDTRLVWVCGSSRSFQLTYQFELASGLFGTHEFHHKNYVEISQESVYFHRQTTGTGKKNPVFQVSPGWCLHWIPTVCKYTYVHVHRHVAACMQVSVCTQAGSKPYAVQEPRHRPVPRRWIPSPRDKRRATQTPIGCRFVYSEKETPVDYIGVEDGLVAMDWIGSIARRRQPPSVRSAGDTAAATGGETKASANGWAVLADRRGSRPQRGGQET